VIQRSRLRNPGRFIGPTGANRGQLDGAPGLDEGGDGGQLPVDLGENHRPRICDSCPRNGGRGSRFGPMFAWMRSRGRSASVSLRAEPRISRCGSFGASRGRLLTVRCSFRPIGSSKRRSPAQPGVSGNSSPAATRLRLQRRPVDLLPTSPQVVALQPSVRYPALDRVRWTKARKYGPRRFPVGARGTSRLLAFALCGARRRIRKHLT
jgi:hypothetical protein